MSKVVINIQFKFKTLVEKLDNSQLTIDEQDMIEDIDEKLREFNQQSSFSDTNLVFKSLERIKVTQNQGCSSLLKSFLILTFIMFISKVRICSLNLVCNGIFTSNDSLLI